LITWNLTEFFDHISIHEVQVVVEFTQFKFVLDVENELLEFFVALMDVLIGCFGPFHIKVD